MQSSEVKRQIMMTVGTIFALLFISTGVVHTLNSTNYFNINLPSGTTTLTFDETFYYMIITIFTIGYGDFFPTTDLARAIIGLLLIIEIIVMSQQTTKLGALMKNTSPYRSTYKTEPGKHIIVTGSFSGTTLFRFLKELYHIDHGMQMKSCRVLIVKDESPPREILALINHPVYEEALQYLEGNLIDEITLKNSAVVLSKGVFILTDQYKEDVSPSDSDAVLICSSVKGYSPSTPVLLQLVKPNLLIHNYWAAWNSGFSTWELKLSMIAANVFTPGFSTFICNLIVSSSGSMKKEAATSHWMNEYIMGLTNELYFVEFHKQLIGSLFSDIVEVLYLYNNSLLIGIETEIIQGNGTIIHEILLNPVNYYIKSGDNAFIIAIDLEDAKSLSGCNLTELNKHRISEDFTLNFSLLKTPLPKRSSQADFGSRHLLMWEADLRGQVWDHILVFGRVEHLEIILENFKIMTNQLICYVSDTPPDDLWKRISLKNKEVLYLECTLSDINELSHTAINFAYHAIILSSKIPGSNMDDSGTLPLVNIIESNFIVKFTVELINEINMKYLDYKLPVELESMNTLTWPRYAAGHVFCSSALDYIMAQGYHNNFIIDIIRRMIVYEDLYAEFGIDENCRINNIEIPYEVHGISTFRDVFLYLLRLERPVIALAIYRGVGILNNEIPYVFTKPDPETPLFYGDKIIVMGEINNRESSPYLKDARKKSRKETTINLSRKKSISKNSQNLVIRKATIAEIATKSVEEDEENEGIMLTDEDLLNMIRNLLDKTKKEREIISNQNETIINLASECTTVQNMLNGLDINDSLEDQMSDEDV